jgi:hypothetical protein
VLHEIVLATLYLFLITSLILHRELSDSRQRVHDFFSALFEEVKVCEVFFPVLIDY